MPLSDGSLGLSLALTAATLIGGTVATYCYDRRTPLLWRLPSGACTGLAALGVIGFVLAMRFGLRIWVVALAGVAVASPAALLLMDRYRQALRADLKGAVDAASRGISLGRRRTAVRAGLYGLGTLLLWQIADRAMFLRQDGIYTGISHNIGDLPFHLTVMNRFVYGGNFPPEHPSFAGVSFTYPFLTDFISGMFVRVGTSVRDVIIWSTLLLLVALAALLYHWTLDLTGNRDAAFVAPVVLFFSGGLGWWKFLHEAGESGAGAWAFFARLPHDYTITYDNEFRWGNIVTTVLVTQRGLLLGLPLALIVFQNWWRAIGASEEDRAARQSRMIAAGVITGMLPLIHAHSFAVVVGMALCLALLSTNRWVWLPFFTWSLALGLPQVWWVAQGSGVRSGTFVAWSLGWDHGDQNVLLFWLKNTGLLIPLIAVALLWRNGRPLVPRPVLLFYLPFTLCFIVPNLFRLAPWIWDNIKILIYWFVASVPLVALLLARLWEGKKWHRALAATLFVALTFAGALDLWRVASRTFRARIFDRAGMDFAKMVSDKTNPTSLILHAAVPNHPVALTGRRSLMGYPGHVWSHGLDSGPREADIKRIYAGEPDAAGLLARYRIDYVVVDPPGHASMTINEEFFEQYPRVGETGGYRLYRTALVQH